MVMKSERTGEKFVEMYEASLGENPNLEEQFGVAILQEEE